MHKTSIAQHVLVSSLIILAVWGDVTGVAAEEPAAAAAAAPDDLAPALTKRYLTNAELKAWGDDFAARCRGVARKFSFGKSVAGAPLWGVEISDKPGVDEPEPNFKYVANMHGNEPSGRMLLPMLAEWLCANNGKDERATRLVRDTHLFLVPTMNPDGFAARRRSNQNGVDLNRNFPDPIQSPAGADLRAPLPGAQPETKAVMAWSLERPFAASANLHEGAVVANIPLDGARDGTEQPRGEANLAPDDAAFQMLARTYARAHPFMAQSAEFPGGVTNGAKWYPVYGGMQDWNYLAAGTMGVTLELSDRKYRPESDLPLLWRENRDALLALPLRAALGGVRGTVTAAGSGAPLAATLAVERPGAEGGGPVPFYASKKHGFYARPLEPGKHTIVVTAPGYQTAEAEVEVPTSGEGVVHDFALKPTGGSSSSSSETDSSGDTDSSSSSSSSDADSSGGGSSWPSGNGGRRGAGAAGGLPVASSAARMRASAWVLAVHGAVFAAIAAASGCQSAGLLVPARLRRTTL